MDMIRRLTQPFAQDVGTATPPASAPAASICLVAWCPSPRGRQLLAMLDHKRLPYRQRIDAAAGPWPDHCGPEVGAALELNGRLMTALDEITWALERLVPHRPLLPQAPEMRALCLALNEWTDDALYPLTLHYQWMDAAGAGHRRRDFPSSTAGQQALDRRQRVVHDYLQARGWLGRPASTIESTLHRQLHAIDAMLFGRRFLFGQAPTLSDFGLASQLAALAVAPGSAEAVAQRPVIVDYLDRCWSLAGEAPIITQGSFGPRGSAAAALPRQPRSSVASLC